VVIQSDADATWQVEFGSPQCTQLVPGVFDNAAKAPNSDPKLPELRVSHYPRWECSSHSDDGRFIVHEVQFGEFGELYRFVAEFEQVCNQSPAGIAFRGGVRYVSRRPTPATAIADADADGLFQHGRDV
jgi:hypothetical protein